LTFTADIVDGALDVSERLLDAWQQACALAGQMHLTAIPPKQWSRQILFKRTDLQAGSAGRDPERVCGAREI
jgi:hypothetical protein